jgi:hypothetical protein
MTRDLLGMPVLALPHAVTRFNEQVRPGLATGHAGDELDRLLDIADYTFEPPRWVSLRSCSRAPVYAVIGDVALPLQIAHNGTKLVAVTCLTRGGLSQPARERRNAMRRRRNARLQPPALRLRVA